MTYQNEKSGDFTDKYILIDNPGFDTRLILIPHFTCKDAHRILNVLKNSGLTD